MNTTPGDHRAIREAHMRQVRLGYLDLVPFVARLKERVSPVFAHEHAMMFLVLDALESA